MAALDKILLLETLGDALLELAADGQTRLVHICKGIVEDARSGEGRDKREARKMIFERFLGAPKEMVEHGANASLGAITGITINIVRPNELDDRRTRQIITLDDGPAGFTRSQ